MSKVNTEKIADKLKNLASHQYAQHILFWFVLFAVFVFLDNQKYNSSYGFIIAKELINVFFLAAIVYINLYYLIPKYLSQKHFFWYLNLLILVALIITPLKTMVFYLFYSNYPETQTDLIQEQGSIFLATFFIGGISTVYKIMNDWVIHQREVTDLENKNLQSELNFLKSQINPHFLFNTLNNLYALTLKKSEKAPEIVLKLSEMMRYMLYECNERRVPLIKEVNYIKNYLELEKLRQTKNFNIKFQLDGEIRHQKIAPLMFIPFLENSFKHGLSNQISSGFVNIKLNVEEKEVFLEIENSKAPTLPKSNMGKKSGGIGLVNIRKRLNLLYPDQYLLFVEEDPNRYKVNFKLQLND